MANSLASDDTIYGIRWLGSGQTVVVPRRARATLKVHNGVVWATSSGDLDDVWLAAGQEHHLEDKGRTVIESAAPATIELVPAAANDMLAGQPALSWRRLCRWLDDVGVLMALLGFVALVGAAAGRIPL
jgi:hypothetical protein